MGHIAHYKAGAVGQLVAHIERTRENPAQYGNEKIDPKKTHLNFSPEKCEGFPVFRYWEQVAEKQGQQRKSSDNALTGVIFTLPQRYLKKPKEWQDEFFRNTYDFLKNKFGVEKDGHSNIYCASVHYDETTPHLHFAFVPVVRNDFERHYKDRHGEIRTATVKAGSISSRYVVNKTVLSSLHQELDRYLTEQQRGYTGGILLSDEEKIDRHLMLPAKELKQMPEDYLKEARKISKGLRVKHLINDLEAEKKEIDRVRLETKATQEIVAEQKKDLDSREKTIGEQEKNLDSQWEKVNDYFAVMQDYEAQNREQKEQLEDQEKNLNEQRTELRQDQALHQKELDELRKYKKEKAAYEKEVAEWNEKSPVRIAIQKKYQEMQNLIDGNQDVIEQLKSDRQKLADIEQIINSRRSELQILNENLDKTLFKLNDDEKLNIYRFFTDMIPQEAKDLINVELKKGTSEGNIFYEVYSAGEQIDDNIYKAKEMELPRQRQPEHVMTR